jgi:hypothetical protein
MTGASPLLDVAPTAVLAHPPRNAVLRRPHVALRKAPKGVGRGA